MYKQKCDFCQIWTLLLIYFKETCIKCDHDGAYTHQHCAHGGTQDREQINVGDKQFVKGMIPHHAAAVLMSEKAKLTDPELIELQKNILETQAKEIEFMKRKLKEFQNK